MWCCMTWNKVVNRHIKVLYSQGSLGMIEDFITDEDGKLNSVETVIVLPGIRVFLKQVIFEKKLQLD